MIDGPLLQHNKRVRSNLDFSSKMFLLKKVVHISPFGNKMTFEEIA
jgi:hypothetical protein